MDKATRLLVEGKIRLNEKIHERDQVAGRDDTNKNFRKIKHEIPATPVTEDRAQSFHVDSNYKNHAKKILAMNGIKNVMDHSDDHGVRFQVKASRDKIRDALDKNGIKIKFDDELKEDALDESFRVHRVLRNGELAAAERHRFEDHKLSHMMKEILNQIGDDRYVVSTPDGRIEEGFDAPSSADELELYGDNDRPSYFSSHIPIVKNLLKKIQKNVYDHDKAKTLWGYHADRVAKRYATEFGDGTPWHEMIPKNIRKQYASNLADREYKRMTNGEYNLDESRLMENAPSAGLTHAEKSRIVKRARKGDDIGKKGHGFEKIEKKFEAEHPEEGEAAARKVAAAVMWRNVHRESFELNEDKNDNVRHVRNLIKTAKSLIKKGMDRNDLDNHNEAANYFQQAAIQSKIAHNIRSGDLDAARRRAVRLDETGREMMPRDTYKWLFGLNESVLSEGIERVRAREILQDVGAPIPGDFHELNSMQVDKLLDHAKNLNYRHSRNASGSKARYFHDHLQRIVASKGR